MIFSLHKNVPEVDKMFAHRHKDNDVPREPLECHLKTTIEYYRKLCENKHVDKLVTSMIDGIQRTEAKKLFTQTDRKFIFELFEEAIFLHDIGKINPNFQIKKMKNTLLDNVLDGITQHSVFSAIIYLDYFNKRYNELKLSRGVRAFIVSFSYIISRHHSDLQDYNYEDYIDALEKGMETKYFRYYRGINSEEEFESLRKMIQNIGKRNIVTSYEIKEKEYFILNKLLYSIIVACDFYATSEYDTRKKIELSRIKSIDLIRKEYEETEQVKKIRLYEKGEDEYLTAMNQLRSDLFLETEKTVTQKFEKSIFYYEAPTGSGKTNTSLNLAFRLLEKSPDLNSILYVFPFNTLVEQTANSFSFLKERKDYVRVNSITPILSKEDMKYEDEIDWKQAYSDYQFLHYPIILTSHINLFQILFGTGRQANLLLQRVCNSVIILDEIQSYRNDIWRGIIEMLGTMAEVLHFKVIIMSATLPKLGLLLENEDQEKICSLLSSSKKYFEHPVFKERVLLHFELLEQGRVEIEELLDFVIEKIKQNEEKKILIEFIKKTTAREFYNLLKNQLIELYGEEKIKNYLYELSGDDNACYRKALIQQIRKEEPIVVIATQVIEAGVDIDMDIGLKDISILDSEEQFIGRINRSSQRSGEAWFFDLDKTEMIYRNDVRTNYNLYSDEIRDNFIKKDYAEYYIKVLNQLKEISQSFTLGKNIEDLYEAAKELQFTKVREKLQLITQKNIQVFLNITVENEGETIVGSQVWQEYKTLVEDRTMGFEEREIRLSRVREQMQYFTYNIPNYDNKFTIRNGEEFGNLFYYDNGYEFMEDGKFNRKKFAEYSGEVVW